MKVFLIKCRRYDHYISVNRPYRGSHYFGSYDARFFYTIKQAKAHLLKGIAHPNNKEPRYGGYSLKEVEIVEFDLSTYSNRSLAQDIFNDQQKDIANKAAKKALRLQKRLEKQKKQIAIAERRKARQAKQFKNSNSPSAKVTITL